MADDARLIPDERLRLIFVCCHPAVAVEARAALTLRLVCGLSIAEIAREKAGIIKPATPVISAPQRTDAESVIKQHADACGAPLQVVNETWTNSRIALRGEHQKINAAVAMAAVRAANISISDEAVARGFQSVEWPARFQIWNDKIVIDGAHNPAAAKILAQTWRE